ncbi:DUF2505 domain-containing protein [Amycolatopsis pigmentata]|uniref:DUF2505 domain-containing protein n=1 Tax=Amycolatopsis pigmentata TaxID=450801 RepID=A0ABW5FU48_9PSEU
MAARIEHRAEFSRGIADVFTAVAGREAVQARLDAIGGHNARIVTYSHDGDQWRFVLHQGVTADKLPSFVRTLHRGDLVVEREHTWTKTGDTYTGAVKATVSGVPGDIGARTDLVAEGARTVLRTNGEVKVHLPFVGGKIEGFVAGQVTDLLRSEAEFTAQWLGEPS